MRLYEPRDYETIEAWHDERLIDAPPRWALPSTGVIVDGIAAGFLITTNNQCAFLEGFISNPKSQKEARDKALDGIVDYLSEMAKSMRVKSIQCSTTDEAIKKRAIKHGFNFTGTFSYFAKGL